MYLHDDQEQRKSPWKPAECVICNAHLAIVVALADSNSREKEESDQYESLDRDDAPAVPVAKGAKLAALVARAIAAAREATAAPRSHG